MEQSEITAANRQSWNQAAPVLAAQRHAELLAKFSQPGFVSLDATEKRLLNQIGLAGKSVAQLACNNGQELLSILNYGAARGVGFDIADNFIEQARELNAAAGLNCEFVRSDIYAIPKDYNRQFDIVYISAGVLGWFPEVKGFFEVVARVLKSAGRVLVYEMHPMLDMFEVEDKNDPPTLVHSYFRTEPYVEQGKLDYEGKTEYESSPSYWFHHKLSDIFAGLIAAELAIEAFEEYDHDVSAEFSHFGQLTIKPPLSYSLIAELNHPF